MLNGKATRKDKARLTGGLYCLEDVLTTQKQKDSAIKRTFKRLEKIAERKDKLGYNPYKGIFYLSHYFYVTDSICMVKVTYDKDIELSNTDYHIYSKVNVIEQVDQVRLLFNLYQDDDTERMTNNHNNRGLPAFDGFFDVEEDSEEIHIDPKRLGKLLDIFAINKVIPAITHSKNMIKLVGFNDFCRIEAVLMGIRK